MWQFFLATLAVYRVACLITSERGPFDTMHLLRTWVYGRWPDDKFGVESWQFAGITCPLCVSFWLSLVLAAWLPYTTGMDYLVTALALAGAAAILHKEFKK